MSRLLRGEEEFIRAYELYADAIFRHCYFRVYDRERAKELMQEVFMKTWRYHADGKKIENIRAFLYKVANHLVIDESRKKKERSLEAMQEQGFDPGFDHPSLMRLDIEVKQALSHIQGLDEKYRDIILLRYVEGYMPRDIAKLLGLSENIISVRLHRGLKKLREIMPL